MATQAHMVDAAKPNPLVELSITLIIPALILMKLSGPEDLGAAYALALALSFPLTWGIRDFWKRRKVNLFAALGVISTVLTGGIGLLALDTQWLAIKEAAVPGLIGLAVLGSTYTRYPLVKTILLNPAIIDVVRLQEKLEAHGASRVFETRLLRATWMLSGTFFFSSAMNYFLATYLVVSPAGTAAFNEELGRLTLLSYPFIALPSMAMMILVIYYLSRATRELTGLSFTEFLGSAQD
ncbi:MAG: VC0807 family protein [Rhodocyclaceae bacterium]|nr:VC0807 family protein [Rhodocyclaceae bacterium]MDZ4214932.1 VC0807 family protein [Rhodocyclaceae bacterium]